jgi:hypothetical protein
MAEFNTLCVEKIKNKVLGWAPQKNVEEIISWLQVFLPRVTENLYAI